MIIKINFNSLSRPSVRVQRINNLVDISFFLEHKSLESNECFICEFKICVKGISTSLRIFAPLRESKIISHQPFIYIFTPTAIGLKDHRVSSPGQANACERHPGYPSPRTLRPERAKDQNYIAYSYRFCPFRAPSGVSSHPGCRSLRSLALGLVLLPRWGVSLQIMISMLTHYVVLGLLTQRHKGAQRGWGVDESFSFVERLGTGVDRSFSFVERLGTGVDKSFSFVERLGTGVDWSFSFVEGLGIGVDGSSWFQERSLYPCRCVFLVSRKVIVPV